MKQLVVLLFLALAILALSACGDTSEDAIAPEPTEQEVARSVRGDLQPLNQDECDALAALLRQLGGSLSVEQAPFQDQIQGNVGTGCLISVTGTGVQFSSPQAVAERVTSLLTAQSWREDKIYTTSGPSGAATALRKGGRLCLFSAGWWPDGVTCPTDRPLSECAVPAEKRIYQIDLQCVQ